MTCCRPCDRAPGPPWGYSQPVSSPAACMPAGHPNATRAQWVSPQKARMHKPQSPCRWFGALMADGSCTMEWRTLCHLGWCPSGVSRWGQEPQLWRRPARPSSAAYPGARPRWAAGAAGGDSILWASSPAPHSWRPVGRHLAARTKEGEKAPLSQAGLAATRCSPTAGWPGGSMLVCGDIKVADGSHLSPNSWLCGSNLPTLLLG